MTTHPVEPKLKAALGTVTGTFAVLYAIAEVLHASGLALPDWVAAAVTVVLAVGAGGVAGYRAPHQDRGAEQVLRSQVDHPAGRKDAQEKSKPGS